MIKSTTSKDLDNDLELVDWDHFNFDWESEEWVPLGVALTEMVDLNLAVHGDRATAFAASTTTLQRRLEWGIAWARADQWSHRLQYGGVAPEVKEHLQGHYVSNHDADIIGTSFWQNLSEAQRALAVAGNNDAGRYMADIDWVAGDLEFSIAMEIAEGPMKAMYVTGRAFGLCINRSGLPTTQRVQSGQYINLKSASQPPNPNVRAKRVGRPTGSGGWFMEDAPLVEKMRQLIAANPNMSVHRAASIFAEEAAGNAGLERKQRRLADRYREVHPDLSQ